MVDVTVGQVAGIINVAVVVAQLTLPLAVVFVLAGVLKESNNAVTWSVVGRLLNGSSWPTILRTDTAAITRVSKRVVLVSILSTAALIFLGVVSIITPLGLYEDISHGSYEEVEFGYAPDLQPIGRGTPQRTDYNVSRLCGGFSLINCPGQNQGFNFSSNATGTYRFWNDDMAWMSSVVPSNITDIFSSGSEGSRSLVAGAFDIEYRSFIQASDPKRNSSFSMKNSTLNSDEGPDPNIDQGRKRTQAAFRMYESLILNEQVKLVDGLVVDMKVGGIGFRNHTVPIDPGRGSEWTEGLLWIQPETVCVATNISIDYTVPESSFGDIDVALTDRGGFFGLAKEYPLIDLNDTQNRPEIFARAHKGATCNNSNLMKVIGISRNETAVGTSYALNVTSQKKNRLSIQHFGSTPMSMIPDIYIDDGNSSISVDDIDMYIQTDLVTQGFGGADRANINHIAVDTGLMLGAARRLDEGSDRLDPGSRWSAPLHSCATALKAHIMDVSFLINGTNSLANLQVVSMKPRTYSSDASLPLWAVENTGMNIVDVAPFWAVVDDKYESWPHLWTSRKDYLYLPAGAASILTVLSAANSASASADAPQAALFTTYSDATSGRFSGDLPDYSGSQNYPLFLKWQELSQSPDTAPTIVNLIWTDIMANYVVGTKSTLSARNKFADGPINSTRRDTKRPMIRVLRSARKIRYDLRYGIPGIMFLAFYVMAILSALTVWVTGRVHFRSLRTLLNQTATGRSVTVERYGDAARAPAVGTRKWIQAFGEEDIGLRKRPAEKQDSDSERGDTETPPSMPENDQLLSSVETPPEQEQTARQDDVNTEMRSS